MSYKCYVHLLMISFFIPFLHSLLHVHLVNQLTFHASNITHYFRHLNPVLKLSCSSAAVKETVTKTEGWPAAMNTFHVSPSLTWESLPLLWRFLHLLGSTRPSLPVVPISTWTPYYRQVLAMSISPFWPAVCQGPDSSNHLHYVDFHVERFYLSLRNRDMKQGLGKADV